MSYEFEAADEVVKMSMQGMEAGFRVVESASEKLLRTVYLIVTDKKDETKKSRERMRSLIKQRKTLKAFSIYDEDMKKFSGLAKLYGVNFFVLKDQSYGDDITDIIVEEAEANKVNHIYRILKLESPQRLRREGPSPVYKNETGMTSGKKDASCQAQKSSEQTKGKHLPAHLKDAKKKTVFEKEKTVEQKLEESEEQLFKLRGYNLPKTRQNPDKVINNETPDGKE